MLKMSLVVTNSQATITKLQSTLVQLIVLVLGLAILLLRSSLTTFINLFPALQAAVFIEKV